MGNCCTEDNDQGLEIQKMFLERRLQNQLQCRPIRNTLLKLSVLTPWTWGTFGILLPTLFQNFIASRTGTAALSCFSELESGAGIHKSDLKET